VYEELRGLPVGYTNDVGVKGSGEVYADGIGKVGY
jgi:hypothetical protein